MNQNYPEYILKKLRIFSGLEEEDTSRDEEFQKLPPEEVLDQVMKFDGIIGYRHTMLRWISDIFKVGLDPMGEDHSLEDIVEGLRNIVRAQKNLEEVFTVRVVDEDNIIVVFKARETNQ